MNQSVNPVLFEKGTVMIDDIMLKENVEAAVNEEAGLAMAQTVVRVDDGAVTLTGHVSDYAQKCAAGNAANRVPHVKGVKNEIEVNLPFASRRDDDDIAREVKGIMKWSILGIEDRITVTVHNGNVTIEGNVESYFQKWSAESMLCHVKGVKGIVNRIAITSQPDLRVMEADVEKTIEQALEEVGRLEATKIEVEVKEGKVILRGRVHSQQESDAVEEAVEARPGVFSVENYITVLS